MYNKLSLPVLNWRTNETSLFYLHVIMYEHRKLNALVVAGDRGKSHPVFGRNKAFLEINGLPLITHVVSALDEAKSVSAIYVVGPKEKLVEALFSRAHPVREGKPVHVFEQRNNLFENVWYTFLQTIPSYRQGSSVTDMARSEDAENIALVTAADMPLLTSEEVDEFVSQCDMQNNDYIIGLTRQEDLRYYYPARGKPGIRMAHMHFREGNFRQNNMHMVRPFRIENRHYVQVMYDLRYQKEFGNMVRLVWEILRREEGSWKAVGNCLLLQFSLTFARLRLGFLRDWVRRRTRVDSVISCVSALMKTRVSYACTSLGGGALDIDKEDEYKVIKQNFQEWMRYQKEKAASLPACVNSQ
jgi:molybdopterin-guanine dinucleotide biosynthesis protein A